MAQKLQTKPAIQSKTVRLNLMSLLSAILTALLADPTFTEMIGLTFVTILNVVLIFIRVDDTDTKIDGIIKPKEKQKSNLEILEDDPNIDQYGV